MNRIKGFKKLELNKETIAILQQNTEDDPAGKCEATGTCDNLKR